MRTLPIFWSVVKTPDIKCSNNNTKNHLYSKKPVYFEDASWEWRNHNAANLDFTGLTTEQRTAAEQSHAKDLNIDDRISLFQKQLKKEFVYRIPLRYFLDIGKINFRTKIDYRIKLFLETNMERLFESRKALAANAKIPEVDAEIIFTRALFIQYEPISLDKNFRQHLETIMVSKKKYCGWEHKKHQFKKPMKLKKVQILWMLNS